MKRKRRGSSEIEDRVLCLNTIRTIHIGGKKAPIAIGAMNGLIATKPVPVDVARITSATIASYNWDAKHVMTIMSSAKAAL